MKAIAKYLPVEGKIKDGDTILHHKGGLYTAISNNGVLCIETEEYSGAIGPELYKVVKLSAVTQDDISNGDKVWDELRKTYWTCSDKINCNGEIYWKVLGELSPNATWVKEGAKIEIREITHLKQVSLSETGLVGTGVYEVLGPCGHYH